MPRPEEPSRVSQNREARNAASTTQTAAGGRRNGARKKRVSKNKKKGIIDRLIMPGKRMCRMVAFNWNIRATLDRGLRRLACDTDEDLQELINNANQQEKRLDHYWDTLVTFAPAVLDLVLEDADSVEMSLDYSKTTSRSEDNCKFKKGIRSWRTWSPGQQGRLPASKQDRGLNHQECARMLCPITVNFADPCVRDEFMLNKNPPATHHVWPRCIYAGYIGNPKSPKVGLLRSNLMCKGAVAVLFSPSEAEPDEVARATRPGFADSNDITEVTRPFLAYVATLLRYSLSSEETFNIHGPFDYGAFYDALLAYLDAPAFKADTDELITWWNEKLFPNALRARENPGSDADMMALFQAEKEKTSSGDDDEQEDEDQDEELRRRFEELPLE